MSASELYDRGAQPERTLLAWGRTCLALAVVIALVVKVLAADNDGALIALAALGLALPAVGWALAVDRYRRVHRSLTGSPGVLPAGGAAVAIVAAASVFTGVLALLLVLT